MAVNEKFVAKSQYRGFQYSHAIYSAQYMCGFCWPAAAAKMVIPAVSAKQYFIGDGIHVCRCARKQAAAIYISSLLLYGMPRGLGMSSFWSTISACFCSSSVYGR